MDRTLRILFSVVGVAMIFFSIPCYLSYQDTIAKIENLTLIETNNSSEIKNNTMNLTTVMTPKGEASEIDKLYSRKILSLVTCIFLFLSGVGLLSSVLCSYVCSVLKEEVAGDADSRGSSPVFRLFRARFQQLRRSDAINEMDETMRSNERAAQQRAFNRRFPNAEDIATADQSAPSNRYDKATHIIYRRPGGSVNDAGVTRRVINDPVTPEPVIIQRAPDAEDAAAADKSAPSNRYDKATHIIYRRPGGSVNDAEVTRRVVNDPITPEPVISEEAPDAEDAIAADQSVPSNPYEKSTHIIDHFPEESVNNAEVTRRVINDPVTPEPVIYEKAPDAEDAATDDQSVPSNLYDKSTHICNCPKDSVNNAEVTRRVINDPVTPEPVIYQKAPDAEDVADLPGVPSVSNS